MRSLRALPAAGDYGVILADPPWRFKTFSELGEGKSASRHYNTMLLEELCDLPVREIAGRHCALFLWCVWPSIFDAERLIKAWGFDYSGLAWEWLKFNHDTGKFAFGGGYGTRKNCEPCLLARRGSPRNHSRSERDFILAPRREHSRKPDEQYERIERMYPSVPSLEMFARQRRRGWDAWGNQTRRFGVSS